MVFVDYSTSQEILNKSENNKIANKILMYSGSAESTDLALNKLKELKIDESKYFIEKDSNAFEESLEVSKWNKTYNKSNDLFYYVRRSDCSFVNFDSMVKRKNL